MHLSRSIVRARLEKSGGFSGPREVGDLGQVEGHLVEGKLNY